MELIEGRSLAALLGEQRGPIAPQLAIHLAKQLATALGAVHAGGVVHRNVKPANAMLTTQQGDPHFLRLVGLSLVKLSDPGLVADELTARGAVVGTPAYMSPEALVDSSGVDLTADVYSLGVVLHELITGRLPYGGVSSRSVIDQLMAKQQGTPEIRIEPPNPTMSELLGRMLHPDRRARPQSMSEVLEGLTLTPFADETPTRPDLTVMPHEPFAAEGADPTLPGRPRRSS
jgi:serine/threonine protein kinase